MSTTPGVSPITPDIEDVRRSGESGSEDVMRPADNSDAATTADEAAETEGRPDR